MKDNSVRKGYREGATVTNRHRERESRETKRVRDSRETKRVRQKKKELKRQTVSQRWVGGSASFKT